MLVIYAQIEKCSLTLMTQRLAWPWRKVAQMTGVSLSFPVGSAESFC